MRHQHLGRSDNRKKRKSTVRHALIVMGQAYMHKRAYGHPASADALAPSWEPYFDGVFTRPSRRCDNLDNCAPLY